MNKIGLAFPISTIWINFNLNSIKRTRALILYCTLELLLRRNWLSCFFNLYLSRRNHSLRGKKNCLSYLPVLTASPIKAMLFIRAILKFWSKRNCLIRLIDIIKASTTMWSTTSSGSVGLYWCCFYLFIKKVYTIHRIYIYVTHS